MQLVQISEPHDSKLDLPEVAVGIDFGTTNSLIAVIRDGKVFHIPDEHNKITIPSIVSYSGNVLKVGNDVSNDEGVYSIKRLIGKTLDQVCDFSQFDFLDTKDNQVMIKVNDKLLNPIEIAAYIMGYLKKIGVHSLGKKVKHAVITVPAYFNDIERHAVKDAAKIAGLEVLRLINEPTAAALAYGLHNSKIDGQILLIYDLGGGTFDVSILKKYQGIFQVLGTGGDIFLGGDDFDYAIAHFIIKKYPSDKFLVNDLLPIARSIKEKLTKCEQVEKNFYINGNKYAINLTLQQFNDLIFKNITRTIQMTEEVIDRAKLSLGSIDSIILIGGSTRIPLVRKMIKDKFGEGKVLYNIDPETTVVSGAAIQAQSLTSDKNNNVLIDVLPLSLGIEIMGGLMEVIIERNTPLPMSKFTSLTTFYDGQTVIKINVCQGEREMVKYNKSLACFELQGITSLPAGKVKVIVTFCVDVDGLLTVTALEEGLGGAKKEVNVSSNYNLDEGKIDKVVEEAFEYAEEDLSQRQLIENKMEGMAMVSAIHNVINSNKYNFSQDEHEKLQNLLSELKGNLEGNDVDLISSQISSLENYFQPLIKKKINNELSKLLVGKDIKGLDGGDNE